MSELGDIFLEMRQERKAELLPEREQYARERLVSLGCKLSNGPDSESMGVEAPDGSFFVFWPYNGWFNGAQQGRGIKNLCNAVQGKRWKYKS